MGQAVFLDRDGLLNELILNPLTGEYESPHDPQHLVIINGIVPPLKQLSDAGFALFLVSNQPSYAKGKTTLENIQEIHRCFANYLRENGVVFRDYYYCYHHPDGIVPAFSGPCACRKPAPFFLLKAKKDHGIDLSQSWMIGDQDFDVDCGQAAGCRTILVPNDRSSSKRGQSKPDFIAVGLSQAVAQILTLKKEMLHHDH